MYLEKVHSPEDLKNLTVSQMEVLAGEIRGRILSTVSRTGGIWHPVWEPWS